MTTKNKTPFNQLRTIKSELTSEKEREEKVEEMTKRGFYVARLFEYEKDRSDYVATGYANVSYRYSGNSGRTVYGVIFRRDCDG